MKIKQFTVLLESGIEIYRNMFRILEKEKKYILSLQEEKLRAICSEKENLLSAVRDFESKRLDMLHELADSLGYAPQELTISRLIRVSDEPYAGRIEKCRQILSKQIGRIREMNRSNRVLAGNRLELIKGAVSLLGAVKEPQQIYYGNGEVRDMGVTGKYFSHKV
ncbi:MAG: flagellar protein FlgN [Desulfococcaceae bacterium]|jgi:flagellar biosynthesis/type III secretory pathway chaperone|nr:flagellar protein FlgN [Desulfococcaceae bacterium]